MSEDTWAAVAGDFADGAYATVKGRVRTYVMHRQLLEHLPAPPASVLDVGGGVGHQSFPLAHAGYDVTLLDSSAAMLTKARQRLPAAVASTPSCATACSDTWSRRSPSSTSCAGVPRPAVSSR